MREPGFGLALLFVFLVIVRIAAAYFLFAFSLAAQTPTISSIVNQVTGDTTVVPGALVAVFGSDLTFQLPDTVPLSE